MSFTEDRQGQSLPLASLKESIMVWNGFDSFDGESLLQSQKPVLNLRAGDDGFVIFKAPINVSCWIATWNHEKRTWEKYEKCMLCASSTFQYQILVRYTVVVAITTEWSRGCDYAYKEIAARESCSPVRGHSLSCSSPSSSFTSRLNYLDLGSWNCWLCT